MGAEVLDNTLYISFLGLSHTVAYSSRVYYIFLCCLSIRYHTGSLAFGSLILAIVQVIRVLLEYLDHKLKGNQKKIPQYFMIRSYLIN